jgi:hypothetical protein
MQNLTAKNIFGMVNGELISEVTPSFDYLSSNERIGTKFPLIQYQNSNRIKLVNHLKGPNIF